MQDHNTRAKEMWSVISPEVSFEGKTVIDIGCGHGDMSRRVFDGGVSLLVSIDSSYDNINATVRNALRDTNYNTRFIPFHRSFEQFVMFDIRAFDIFDIAICFSVLPYFKDGIPLSLQKIASICKYALLECQYHGDGPGPEELKSSEDFKKIILNNGFSEALLMGYSVVKSRGLHRDIFYCKSDINL